MLLAETNQLSIVSYQQHGKKIFIGTSESKMEMEK